jgi:hypothetical protein
VVGYFSLDRTLEDNIARSPMGLVRKHCRSIPDPDTVPFMAKHAGGGAVPRFGAVFRADRRVEVTASRCNGGANTTG